MRRNRTTLLVVTFVKMWHGSKLISWQRHRQHRINKRIGSSYVSFSGRYRKNTFSITLRKQSKVHQLDLLYELNSYIRVRKIFPLEIPQRIQKLILGCYTLHKQFKRAISRFQSVAHTPSSRKIHKNIYYFYLQKKKKK